MIRALVKFGVVASALVVAIAWPAAWLVDRTSSVEVIPVDRFFEPEVADANLLMFDPLFALDPEASPEERARQHDRELASAYALGPRAPTRLVFVDDARVKRVAAPDGGAEVVLYAWPGSHHPIQSQSLYWLARMVSIGAGGGLALLLALGWLMSRRRAGCLAASA